MLSVAKIYSTLGNPKSLVPLMVKDFSATAGMTATSFVTGKEEGQDRFIDEVGTQAIWLGGLPGYKLAFDKTAYKIFNIDPNFDVRNLQNKEIFEKTKEYAPTDKIAKELEKIGKKQPLVKNLALAKFIFATVSTVATYVGLTKAKQNYTDKKIRQNLIAEHNKKCNSNKHASNNDVSFKGFGKVVDSFVFNPVKNMWILDGAITGERLNDSRSAQEFIGYSIKEASTLCFMYYAGGKIQKYFENRANKKFNKSIELDARVIENGELQKLFANGSIEKCFAQFKNIKNASDAELYDFIHKNPDNEIIKVAKQSDIITMYKNTDKIDTRAYIDPEKVRATDTKLQELYKQYKDAAKKGDSAEKFFNGVKKLKRHSIRMNIELCILALGVVTPLVMLGKRLIHRDDTEFQTKVNIREQLIKEGVISA